MTGGGCCSPRSWWSRASRSCSSGRGRPAWGAATPRASSPYTENARYLTSLDGFNIKHPAVPAHVFRAERDRALAPGAPTGLVPLDLSPILGKAGASFYVLSDDLETRGFTAAQVNPKVKVVSYGDIVDLIMNDYEKTAWL